MNGTKSTIMLEARVVFLYQSCGFPADCGEYWGAKYGTSWINGQFTVYVDDHWVYLKEIATYF